MAAEFATTASAAITWAAGQNPAAQNITIPADATAVYLFWSYYNGADGHGLLSATLAGNAPNETFEVVTAPDDETATGVAAWYNPPTGTRSLQVSWDAAPAEGPTSMVAYVKGGGAWRDADGANEDATAAVSVTLTTVAGDLVIKYDQRFANPNTAPPLTSGWTDRGTTANNSELARLSSIVAAGTSQVCDSENEQYSSIVAVAIPEASAGGTTTTKTMTDTVTAADERVQWSRRFRIRDEAAALVDAVIANLVGAGTVTAKTLTDALDLAEQLQEWTRRTRQTSDTLTIFDDPNRTIQLLAADEMDMTDESTDWTRRVRQQTDTLDLSEDRWRRIRKAFAENVDIVDGFIRAVAGVGITYARVLSDTMELIDDSGQRWTFRGAMLTEALNLTDSKVQALARIRILGDDVEYADGVITIRRSVRAIDENLDLTDDSIRSYYPDQAYAPNFRFGADQPFRFGAGVSNFTLGMH